jgi:Gluconate 2-dehydrogenase subunit 3
MSTSALAPVRGTFRAVAETVVPEAQALAPDEWRALEAIVEEALAQRPAKLRRQLRLLVRMIEITPALRYGRGFTALDPARRTAVLRALQDAPLLLLRRGFWGLRTLVLMGYYARPAAAAEIGYRADARGWEIRR